MILLAISLAASSETLLIVSNFILAFSTILLYLASEHEQHQTMKALMKANNSLMQLIVKAFTKRQK